MKKIFSFLIVLLGLSIGASYSQVTVTVGTGITTTQYNPVYSLYGYNYTQQIYTSAELTAGGALAGMQINAIRFYWAGGTGNLTNTETWTVYLANSTQNDFATTTSWLPIAQFTEVYTGAVALPATAGWMTINLTTPYIWNGSNIIVAVDENVSGYGSTVNWTSTSTGSTYRAIYYYNDYTNPDPASPPTASGRTYNRPNIQFDMVSLTPCTGTPAPGNTLASSNPACSGVPIVLSLSTPPVGAGITYQWQSSPDGTTWTNIPGATSSVYNTSITVATHYRCLVTCNDGPSTANSTPVHVTIAPPSSCYCIPGGSSASYYINNFSTTGGAANITNNGSGYSTGGYGDFTGQSVSQVQNSSVNFSAAFVGGTFGFAIWVDWNQNGTFEAGERVFVSTGYANSATGSFTVPLTATPGNTKMRIKANYFNTAPSNPCLTSFSGEFEDYTFNVVALTACSGTPNNGIAAVSVAVGCPATPFQLSATDVTIGTGIQYQWQSSAFSTGPWTNIPGATSPSYTATTSSNAYYQLVTTCTNSSMTATSNVVSYTVDGNPCACGTYPAIYPSSTADEDISNVTVGTMSNSSTCATLAPGTGSILNRYSNYTGHVTGPTVQTGQIVNFSLTQTSCGSSYNNGFQIYIDYNQDGDFLDAGEQVYNQPVAATGNHTKTGTFAIPMTATLGTTRMRITNTETTFPTSNNYTSTTFSYGEVEDYCITIVAATACAGTPVGGSASPASQIIPTGTTANLSLTGSTVASGLTYQWQQSASAAGPFADITGATSINLTTAAVNADTYYRCIVTCTASAESAISAAGLVQVVNSVNMMNGTITTCGSLFYDSGGAAGSYGNSESYTLTVTPDMPGNFARVTFTSFETENTWDYLYVYNGNSIAAPLLGTYTGTTVPPTLTSTATDGSLTFRFTSDGSGTRVGWVANLTCYNPCVPVTPTFTPMGPYCSGWAINELPTTSNNGFSGTWSPAINNLTTTTYTFTPNVGECSLTTTMTITINPNNPATFTQVGSYCQGATIPALPLTSTDGITGTWSPAINNMQTTEYIFSASGGVCAWTSMTIQIDSVPAGITNNSGSNVLTCSLQNISLTANGGSTYTWTGGPATVLASINVTTPATYTVTVFDTNGCSISTSIDITQNINPPTALITNNTGTDELICSVPSISLTASGGASYAWSGGAASNLATNTFTSPGTYIVTVTGANGCTNTGSYTITQADTLDITKVITDALCYAGNGSAEIIINSGGNAPFSIAWPDGSTSFLNTNVPASTNFTYTITDADLCETIRDVYVNDPDLIVITIVGDDLSCYGTNDGVANASNTVGGVPPFSYSWANGSHTATISNLAAGNYRVTVVDDNGCAANNSVVIAEPDDIIINLDVTDANCGVSGGQISTVVGGGVGGYTYVWSNGSSMNNLSGLIPDDYTITVTDSNYCTKSATASVGRTGDIIANISVEQPISCAGIPDGVIHGGSVNGVMPLTFNWSNGSTSEILSSISAGTYYLTVTDNWGCSGSVSETLNLPNEIALSYFVTDLKCFESNDGKINLSLSGGDPPFSLQWSNSATGTSLNSLQSGQYSVTITDSRNCIVTQNFVVNQPAPIVFEYSKKDVSCYGRGDGSITMNASGGSEPYSYTVSTNQVIANTQTVNSLYAGDYSIFVKDNNNCIATGNVAVYQPAVLSAKITTSNPSCIGHNDGFIAVYPIGGTAPYSYSFNNMDLDTSVYTRLREGDYTVFLTDVNGCEYKVSNVRLNEAIYDCLDIPTAFTPNGDGVNDKWEIRNLDFYPGAYVHVFNRWGQEVYTGRPTSEPWDGTYNGRLLPVGAYLYIINPHNDAGEYKGTVSIVH